MQKLPSHYILVQDGEATEVPFSQVKHAAIVSLRSKVNELIEMVERLEGKVDKLHNDTKHGDLWRLKAK